MPGTYGDNRRHSNIHSNFLVTISSKKHGHVIARVPERLSMSLRSEWDTILAGGVHKFFNFLVQEAGNVLVTLQSK
jgi:hypothetical protein